MSDLGDMIGRVIVIRALVVIAIAVAAGVFLGWLVFRA